MDELLAILQALTCRSQQNNSPSSNNINNNNSIPLTNVQLATIQQIMRNQQTPGSIGHQLAQFLQPTNAAQPSFVNTNPMMNGIPVIVNTQHQLPSGNFNSNCGGVDQSDTISPIQNQLINLNLQNTFMGGTQQFTGTAQVDQHCFSPASSSTFSTPSSSSPSSSSTVSDSASFSLNVQKKKKKKIGKSKKMRESISVGYISSAVQQANNSSSSSSMASSSTDLTVNPSGIASASSTSTGMQFIHVSNEEMKIKYDSESSASQVKPKRKRGRPKKPEPKKPDKYEFVPDGWNNDSKSKK